MYVVKILMWDNLDYCEHIPCKGMDERQAERVERGVNINLNHDEYYTQLEFIVGYKQQAK